MMKLVVKKFFESFMSDLKYLKSKAIHSRKRMALLQHLHAAKGRCFGFLGIVGFLGVLAVCLMSFYALCSQEERFKDNLNQLKIRAQSSFGLFQEVKSGPQHDYKKLLAKIKQHNPFASKLEDETLLSYIDLEKIERIKGDLRLSGVIYTEPKTVMIEYGGRKNSKILYAGEGEEILEKVRVKRIQPNSVTLSVYGETYELRL